MKSLSCVRLFATSWTVAHQAPPSMGFSRQEHWSGLPFPSPGDLPDPGIEPRSPALQADAFTSELPRKPKNTRVVAISYSRRSSRPRNQTCVSCIFCIGRWILYHCTTWETHAYMHTCVHIQIHVCMCVYICVHMWKIQYAKIASSHKVVIKWK